jgi:predicted O-methyltransferase YrrM
MSELEHDDALLGHLRERLASNPRRGVNAREPHWGRRLGWYAIVRATRPETVVETGTALGLGSCVLAAALLRNGSGRLTTIDIEPETGYLIGGQWASVTDRRVGSSVEILADVGPVDLFLHDSWHTYEFEASEFAAVEPHLSQDAVVLSDNSHDSAALPDWAERTGRRYLFFKEQPRDHWWPGDGIGVAWGHAD